MDDGVHRATFLELLYRGFSLLLQCVSNLPKMPNCAGYMFLKLKKKKKVVLPKKSQSLFHIFVLLM